MTLHIYPVDDLKEHELTTTCECQPRVEFESGSMIVVHSSWDGREAIEEFNEIINAES